MQDGCRLDVNGEDVLVESIVEALQHRVVLGIGSANGEVFLDARNALDGHVLRDFHRIRAPGGYHLAPGADEPTRQLLCVLCLCFTIKPAQFLSCLSLQFLSTLRGDDASGGGLKECYLHIFLCDCFLRILLFTMECNPLPFYLGYKGTKINSQFIVRYS